MQTPVRFTPDVEQPEADEQETTQQLIEVLTSISKKVYEDSGHAMRSVHAKSHALLRGTLTVEPGLPAELAQGLFNNASEHAATLRLSSTPGDALKDTVSTPRGLALKIFDVPGARLPGADGKTQDFIFVNGPVFAAPDAKHFLRSLKLLASTTDKAPGLKSALSLALRGAERVLETVGGKSSTLISLGGHPATHPLGETYFTQVPLRFGDYIAKLRLAPATDVLAALKDVHVDIAKSPNALRELLRNFFAGQGGRWGLEVQLCRDLERMPVEKADVEWPQDLSPFQKVAVLDVPAQDAWPEASTPRVEDALSFSPWHGIEAHRPLGSVMRARKATYEASARFRSSHNPVPVVEPEAPPSGP